jgi:C4-dicarboxylate-binding protein DctP
MKKALFSIVILSIVGCFIFTGSAFSAPKYKLTLGHVEPTTISTHAAALKFKELIAERTDGAVEITVHPNSELGSGADQAQMVQTGAIQMAMLPAGHISTIIPEVQVFTIPFFFPGNIYEMEKLVNGPAGETLKSYFPKRDVKALEVLVHSPKQFTSNKPIAMPDDFKGQKIRTMASPLIMESYKLVGATPVPINYHEVYTALQLGTVDGEENPFWAIGEMKFHEVQKYIAVSNHAYLTSVFIINNRLFEGMPEAIQQAIVKAAKDAIPFQIEADLEVDKENEHEIRAYAKTSVTTLPPDAIAAFRKKMSPIKDIYIKMVGDSGKKVVDAFEKEMNK